MKSFQFAVVLLIACIGSSVALRCNKCIPSSGSSCITTQETCPSGDYTCAYVIFTIPQYRYFKRCMKRSSAFGFNSISGAQIFTCGTDLCN